MVNKNIFFIGDASGIISPVSGEGIFYVLKTAEILKNCIINNNIEKYTFETKKIKRRIKKELILLKFIYSKRIQKIVFKASDIKIVKKSLYKVFDIFLKK